MKSTKYGVGYLAVLLVLCMGLLAGCGGSENTTTAGESTTAAVTASTEASQSASSQQQTTATTGTEAQSSTQEATTQAITADLDDYGLPFEMISGYWMAPVPNYAGTDALKRLRLKFFPDGIVSLDLMDGSSDQVMMMYAGYYNVEQGILSLDLMLDYTSKRALPAVLSTPRDEIHAACSITYTLPIEEGATMTLSEWTGEPLLTAAEATIDVLTFDWIFDTNPGFINKQMVRSYFYTIPEIQDYINAGKTLMVTEEIVGQNMLHVVLGTQHLGNFVSEIHYYLSTAGQVLRYDPATDTYTDVMMTE